MKPFGFINKNWNNNKGFCNWRNCLSWFGIIITDVPPSYNTWIGDLEYGSNSLVIFPFILHKFKISNDEALYNSMHGQGGKILASIFKFNYIIFYNWVG